MNAAVDRRHLEAVCRVGGYDPDAPSGVAFFVGHQRGTNAGRWWLGKGVDPLWCAWWLVASDEGDAGTESPPALLPVGLARSLVVATGVSRDNAGFEEVVLGPCRHGWHVGWTDAVMLAALARVGADRPLLVGGPDGAVSSAVREVAGAAGVALSVWGDPMCAADGLNGVRWRFAPLVVLTPAMVPVVAHRVAEGSLTPRTGVLLVGELPDFDAELWRQAEVVYPEYVAVLPQHRLWLRYLLEEWKAS